MSKQAILIGGFCEIYELCDRCGVRIVGVVDASPHNVEGTAFDYLGDDAAFLSRADAYRRVPLIVVPDAPLVRRRIVERYREAGFGFGSLVSPEADVSPSARLGEGVVIQSHAVLMARVRVGSFVKVNVGGTLFHESLIGDFATIAPRATVLGRVGVGAGAYVGAACTVLPGVTVAAAATVGAGAVVTRDVAEGIVVAGVPAKRLAKS